MTDDDPAMVTEVHAVAAEVFATIGTGRQITPFSSRRPVFGIDESYRVAASVRRMREARGERVVGRKIGFTNRRVWAHAPAWGYMYDSTVHDLVKIDETFSLAGLAEPRIEPEVVFQLAVAPAPDLDENGLLACVQWVAPGFEIVQSIFPGWKFTAADAVAGVGVHGALVLGPREPVASRTAAWSRTLSTFEIDLKRSGEAVDHGCAANVLDGPVSALRYLIGLLAHDRSNPPLAPGEIVATGTLTRALPVAPGETWTTELKGVALANLRVRFV